MAARPPDLGMRPADTTSIEGGSSPPVSITFLGNAHVVNAMHPLHIVVEPPRPAGGAGGPGLPIRCHGGRHRMSTTHLSPEKETLPATQNDSPMRFQRRPVSDSGQSEKCMDGQM
jgi:hypothetical protein